MDTIITQIQQLRPTLPIQNLQLPEGHDMNTMWLNYGKEGIEGFLNDYDKHPEENPLQVINDFKLCYKGKEAEYNVIGGLPSDMTNMKVSLQVVDTDTQRKHRIKIDLFDFTHVQHQCRELSEKQKMDYTTLEADIIHLTDLLEAYREKLYEEDVNPLTEQFAEKELTPAAAEKAVQFLSHARLINNIDKLLEQAGIVGEENNRIMLLVMASSYKMLYLLHGMLQGTSGGGKSHLINAIADCIPQEDVLDMTRITSKSLYHYRDKELTDKLAIVQDFDGLDEEAQFAFREIQSNKKLSSSTTIKDRQGNARAKIKTVTAHFASLIATTKTEIYLDNASRSVLLGIDESTEQTQRIIQRQNRGRAGLIDMDSEQQARQLLRNCMRVLKKYEVVNPFADKITLPMDSKMQRRLNEQYQNFICQITLLHQYQRTTDDKGRLIATREDIRQATDIFFDAIVLKVDELDASTRQFFERLKAYIREQPTGTTYRFSEREIRQFANMGKTTVNKYMKLLQELEYIQRVEGSDNKGYKYVVSYWDSLQKLRERIKGELNQQLETL